MGRRIFDFIGASLLLVATFPLWLLIIITLLLTGSWPFFTQLRLGQRGHEFRLIKFATMRPGSDKIIRVALRGDERTTRLGRFLRRHHFDELPQLINVIRGEMSLVGPRPLTLEYVEHFQDKRGYYERLRVRPGITGLCQIVGRKRLFSHSHERGFSRMFLLDRYYVERRCLLFDSWILLKTIPVFVKGNGI